LRSDGFGELRGEPTPDDSVDVFFRSRGEAATGDSLGLNPEDPCPPPGGCGGASLPAPAAPPERLVSSPNWLSGEGVELRVLSLWALPLTPLLLLPPADDVKMWSRA
jgi:hypothetical protein